MRLKILNGVRYLLQCTDEYWHLSVPSIVADIKMLQTSQTGEQKYFLREDKWKISDVFGRVTVLIMQPSIKLLPKKEKRVEEIISKFPVLAVKLSNIVWPPDEVGEMVALSIDPSGSGWLYVDKDVDYLKFADTEYKRLNYIGNDTTQWDDYVEEDEWPQVNDGIIFDSEFAFRTVWDAFGNNTVIDPVIFTCGGYVPVLSGRLPLLSDPDYYEFYNPTDRAISYNTTTHYSVIVDGSVIAQGSDHTTRPYELTFVETYVIPDDLILDMWPKDMRDNCCKPPGIYEIYSRINKVIDTSGTSVYHEDGESTDAVEGFELGQFAACLYHKYNYSSSNNYTYELILWASPNQEFVIHAGSFAGEDPPDDLYCSDFKLFNFDGAPVAVFCVLFFPDTAAHTFQYFMYYNGEIYRTEQFVNDKGPLAGNWNRHDIANTREDKSLEGYGDVWAFGVYTKKEITDGSI